MGCVLCSALENEHERVIYRDSHVFVLVNIEPVKDGHIMILPVRHAEDLKHLNQEEAQAFLQAIDRCMSAVTDAYGETPMCLVNGWSHRSQPHLHAHVLPSKNGLRGLFVAAEGLEHRVRADDERLKAMAEKLRGFFKEKFRDT